MYAAAAADPVAVNQHLTDRPELASARGGPFGWVPLMYLCYSRVPLRHKESEVVAAATVLLDAGADPNAGYLWRALSTPFTALTGVFGEGEQGPGRQPRHRFVTALARLLLERGAHPVDQQTLYNRMFRSDDSHLELLFDHGLADAGPSPWEQRLGEAMETRDQMWQRQIDWAADHGFAERLALLARHGIDVSGAEPVQPSFPEDPNVRDADGATPLHHAAWSGDLDLIRRLLDAGADPDLADSRYGTTPLGWAQHAYQTGAIDYLSNWQTHTVTTKRALILAGGGIAGIGWETGILRGIADESPDTARSLLGSDVLVGTSAGSTVAAQISSSLSLEALFERQTAEPSSEIDPGVDIDAISALFLTAMAEPGELTEASADRTHRAGHAYRR